MTHDPAPTCTSGSPSEAAVEAYACTVLREVVRLLARRRPRVEADDIAAEVAATVLHDARRVMAAYPDPARYARAAARHAGIAWDRRERVQRGEGVRLFPGADGALVPGRRYEAGNAPVGAGACERLDLVADDAVPVADQVAVSADRAALLAGCLEGLSVADCNLLMLADGHGVTVVEIAERIGQRRETVSRRLNRTRRSVQQNRARMARSVPGTAEVGT